MSSLEAVIENYHEHIFARDILGYLVERVNKLIAFMISNGIEQDRYLISVEPKFLDKGLAFFVPFATRLGQHGQRKESVIVFTVKQLSHRRVQVNCRYSNDKWLTPHVIHLWEKMLEHYEMSTGRVKEPVGANPNAAQVSVAKPEKPKQIGRYRLTAHEIKSRRQKVKEANKIKKDNPQKQWKEIDKQFAEELKISDRTFRSWRHNNY